MINNGCYQEEGDNLMLVDRNGFTVNCSENYPHVICKCELCGREDSRCIEIENNGSSKVCIYCAQKISIKILTYMSDLEEKCANEIDSWMGKRKESEK